MSCNIPPQLLLTSPDPHRLRAAAHTSMTKMKTIHRTQRLRPPLCLTLCYSVAQESKVNFTVKMCRHSWECKSNHSDYLLQKLLTGLDSQRHQQLVHRHRQFLTSPSVCLCFQSTGQLGITSSGFSQVCRLGKKGNLCSLEGSKCQGCTTWKMWCPNLFHIISWEKIDHILELCVIVSV